MSIDQGVLLLDGLPLHPLVIHITVIAVPLSALMLYISLFSKRFRKYDRTTFSISLIATVSAYLASMTGQNLETIIGISDNHTTPGFLLAPVSTVTTVFFGLLILARKSKRSDLLANAVKGFFISVVAISALASLVLTFIAGHTGAKASWGYLIESILGG